DVDKPGDPWRDARTGLEDALRLHGLPPSPGAGPREVCEEVADDGAHEEHESVRAHDPNVHKDGRDEGERDHDGDAIAKESPDTLSGQAGHAFQVALPSRGEFVP